MENQSQLQTEITKHLCQAHAVQIKGLQNSLGEIITQCNKDVVVHRIGFAIRVVKNFH